MCRMVQRVCGESQNNKRTAISGGNARDCKSLNIPIVYLSHRWRFFTYIEVTKT